MSSYVSAALRREVQARADGICEYCLIQESDTYLGCQVDHVLSEKHGGATATGNLAYACTCCNRAKGSDVGSIAASGEFTRFFNRQLLARLGRFPSPSAARVIAGGRAEL